MVLDHNLFMDRSNQFDSLRIATSIYGYQLISDYVRNLNLDHRGCKNYMSALNWLCFWSICMEVISSSV